MEENLIKNFTCNGKCSNCGECCSDVLPVSKGEIKIIKNYMIANKIKEAKHGNFLTKIDLDLTCPFRDNDKKICRIYPVRPMICKSFICSKPIPDIEDVKRLMHETKDMISMREVFFGGISLAEIFHILGV